MRQLIYVILFSMATGSFGQGPEDEGRATLEVNCAVTIAVPLGTQKKIAVRPKWKLDHSEGPIAIYKKSKYAGAEWGPVSPRRVTDIAFLTPAGMPGSIVTSSEDPSLRHFYLGKTSPDHGVISSQSDGSNLWSPNIAAVAPDSTFFVTDGGLSSPVVYYDPLDLGKAKILSRHPFKKSPGLTRVERIRRAKEKAQAAKRYLRAVAGDVFAEVAAKIEDGYSAEDLTEYNQKIRQAAAKYEQALGETYALDDMVIATLITPDSQKIISITDAGEVIVWYRDRRFSPKAPPRYLSLPGYGGNKVSALNSLDETFNAAALSPDGQSIACGTASGRIATYDLADVESGEEEMEAINVTFIPQPKPALQSYPRLGWEVTALGYSRDGRYLIAGFHKEGDDDRTDDEEFAEVGVFRASNLKLIKLNQRNLRDPIQSILPAANGNFITISQTHDSSIKIWRLPQGDLVADAVLERDPVTHYLSSSSGPFDPIHSSAISPDGVYLVTGSDGGNLSIWHIATARLLFTTRIQNDIRGLAFSADGKYLGTGSHLGDSRVYEFRRLISGGRQTPRGNLTVFVGAEPIDDEED